MKESEIKPAIPVRRTVPPRPQLQTVIYLEEVAHDIPDLFRLRAVPPPDARELLRLAASRLPFRMSGPALGQEQLLQTGDPRLIPQLKSILKNVDQGDRARQTVKQLFLVYALDCKTNKEHLLNGFDDQATAERECRRWQDRHRGWYNGFNNFTLFVRGMFLNKSGEGGLTGEKLFVLSADWE